MGGGGCKILMGCNEAGALYIKPWVIHDTAQYPEEENSILKFEGKGSVCPAEDGIAATLALAPKEYVEKAEEEKTCIIEVGGDGEGESGKENFNNRIVVGFTCILNSFSSSQVLSGNKNLYSYVFKPTTEYVKMTIKIE
jgi:hypothetical protein